MGGVREGGACFDCERAGGFFVRVEQSRMSKCVSCIHRLHPGKETGKSKEMCSALTNHVTLRQRLKNINNVDFIVVFNKN